MKAMIKICPQCEGRKTAMVRYWASTNTTEPPPTKYVDERAEPCQTCNGTGTVLGFVEDEK